jgi:glycosyltransferase involved in cell wall biosynthesis
MNSTASKPSLRLRSRARACWELICRERPKVIVISGNAFLYALLPNIRRLLPGTIVVDVLHNEWFDQRDWFNVSSEYARYLHERITISEHWRDVLVEKYGVPFDRVRVFPNAIDLQRFRPDPDERRRQRAARGIPDDVRWIGFVGRLHPQKAPRTFFALARACANDPSLRFVVVGDGELRDALLAEYADLTNLTFLGPTHDVPAVMHALDVAVFTSSFEGFPLTSLEAAAMGVPIIAPDIVGFREQIAAGAIGLSYPATGDPGIDAERIRARLIGEAPALRACGATARRYVERDHDVRHATQERRAYLRTLAATPVGREVTSATRAATPAARKRLILHVGTGKTGSTSLQWFLDTHREALRRRGVLYPKEHRYGYAHYPVAWYVRGETYRIPPAATEVYPNHANLAAQIRAFVEALARVPEPTIVLSSEGLAYAPPQVARALLREFDVRIVIYLRRQDVWIESLYNQVVKMSGLRRDLASFMRVQRRKLDYEALVDGWARAFGDAAITVIPFESASFPLGLERGFLEAIGVPWSSPFVTERRNEALSRDALEFLRGADLLRSRLPRERFHRLVDALVDYSKRYPDAKPMRSLSSPAERAALMAEVDPGNRRVAQRFLAGRETLFSDPVDLAEPWLPYPGLSAEAQARIVAHLREQGFADDLLAVGEPPVITRPAQRAKRIHLHIGLHKTGSSSIQAFLAANAARLAVEGFALPDTLGRTAHHSFARVHQPERSWSSTPRYPTLASMRMAVDRAHEVALAQPGEHVVYSSEALRTCEARVVVASLAPSPVRVVVFLRRQDEWLESQWNQRLKKGLDLPSRRSDYLSRIRFDYSATLQPWADAVGVSSLAVIPFEREQLPLGLERHFLQALGIDAFDGFVVPPPINRRLNRACAAWYREIHRAIRLPPVDQRRLQRLLEEFSALEPDPPEWRNVFSPEERLDLLERHRASNAAVARDLLGRADGVLFRAPEPSRNDPWEPYPGVSQAQREAIVAYLAAEGFDVALLRG